MNKQYTDEQLRELARQARNEYYREYRKKNKHKIKSIQLRYWARKALEQVDQDK